MRRTSLYSTIAALAGFLAASSVQAQTPAPEAGGPAPRSATASFTGASSVRGRGLGVGAATMLNGTSGLLATWGTSSFHVDGIFGLRRYTDDTVGNATTAFTLAGRFWYHLHAASFADFSAGGGVGLVRWVYAPGTPASDTQWDVSMEVGSQIRAFIVPNVALMADLGLGITFATNDDDILVGGQSVGGGGYNFVTGTLGIAYYFE
jgi:hypothetical protein